MNLIIGVGLIFIQLHLICICFGRQLSSEYYKTEELYESRIPGESQVESKGHKSSEDHGLLRSKYDPEKILESEQISIIGKLPEDQRADIAERLKLHERPGTQFPDPLEITYYLDSSVEGGLIITKWK